MYAQCGFLYLILIRHSAIGWLVWLTQSKLPSTVLAQMICLILISMSWLNPYGSIADVRLGPNFQALAMICFLFCYTVHLPKLSDDDMPYS